MAQNTPVSTIRLLTVSRNELNFVSSVRPQPLNQIKIAPVSFSSAATICLCSCSANKDPTTQPIYLADGVVISEIGAINPKDIQNVTVLERGSAQRKYGVIGKNGVIELTMKQTKSTKIYAGHMPEK